MISLIYNAIKIKMMKKFGGTDMNAFSPKTLVFLAIVSLFLTVVCTYLWASLAGVAATVASMFVFITAGFFVCCVNTVNKY